ncbi:MAG: DEAD/DEAH box helicase family protein [bacterium]|nr:DEAD/DEAH box helicase family protein [bacterium]
MIKPYWYQEDCLKATERARWKEKERALVTMASGLGKTYLAAFDALRFRVRNPNARVLYLCHQNYILEQAYTAFAAIHGSKYSFAFYTGPSSSKVVRSAQFVFATLQCMRRHRKRFKPDEFDYVVVDESHHTYGDTYLDVIEYWKPKFCLGLTATPDRTDKQDIRCFFGKEVFFLPIDEAIAQDLLTPVDYRLLTDEVVLKRNITESKVRLSIKKLNKLLFIPRRDEEIAKLIRKHSSEFENPRMIIFCESVAHCDALSRYFEGSASFHYEVSASDRKMRLELFRQGMITTLLVKDVFNEGIDVPQVNVVVFLRATSSAVVFFQQLGRGLRKREGKEKVIVLDFVGNCERIRMLYDFWTTVQAKRKALKAITGTRGEIFRKQEPITLNIEASAFKELAVSILDVVRRKTEGYTKEEALDSLKQFAQKLRRSPTFEEVSSNKSLPPTTVYASLFGDFTKALIAAELPVNAMPDATPRKELLKQLQVLAKELQHSPSQDELNQASKDGKCNCEPVFREEFGSLNKALIVAGLKPTRLVGRSKKALIADLQALGKRLKKVPTSADLRVAAGKGEIASQTVYNDRFGTWNKALKAAGFEPVHVVKGFRVYTRTDVLEETKFLAVGLGRLPSVGDIAAASLEDRCPSVSTIYKHFGNMEKFHEALKKFNPLNP